MLPMPSIRLPRLVVPLAIAIVAAASCHTFPTDPNATRWDPPPAQFPLTFVSGRVFRQGTSTPIAGVTVEGGTSRSVTDSSGFYALDGYRASQMLVSAMKEGFDTLRVSIVLNGNNQTFNIALRQP